MPEACNRKCQKWKIQELENDRIRKWQNRKYQNDAGKKEQFCQIWKCHSSNTINFKIQYLGSSSKKLITHSKLETLQVGMDLDETWHDVILWGGGSCKVFDFAKLQRLPIL